MGIDILFCQIYNAVGIPVNACMLFQSIGQWIQNILL